MLDSYNKKCQKCTLVLGNEQEACYCDTYLGHFRESSGSEVSYHGISRDGVIVPWRPYTQGN